MMANKPEFVHIVDVAGREWFIRVGDIVAVRRENSGSDSVVVFTRTAGSLLLSDSKSVDRLMYYVLGLVGPMPGEMHGAEEA